MILAGAHAGPIQRARFRTEAAAIARLQHPNIVQIHHVGECDGNLFFAMEMVEGGSLATAAEAGPWDPRRAAAVVEKLARAVHAVHSEGIVHRDLKPHNVLLTADGEPKVVDFGLAKLAGADQIEATVGTKHSARPDMAPGRPKAGPATIGSHTDVCPQGHPLPLATRPSPSHASDAAGDHPQDCVRGPVTCAAAAGPATSTPYV